MLKLMNHRPRALSRVLVFFLISIACCDLSSAPCYDWDGSVIPGDTACSPNAGQSMCCGQYWTCLPDGVCSDQNTTQYIGSTETLLARATCTDPTYKSDVCPQFCTGDLGRGITTFPGNNSFCCQTDLDQPCYSDPNVKTLNLDAQVPLTTISITASTSSAASVSSLLALSSPTPSSTHLSLSTTSSRPHSSTSTQGRPPSSNSAIIPANAQSTSQQSPPPTTLPTPTPQSHGLSEGAIIGLSVGITLIAVSSVGALLFLWYRRRERRKREDNKSKSELPSNSQFGEKGYYAPQYTGGQGLHEMEDPTKHTLRGELPEVSDAPRREMAGSVPEQSPNVDAQREPPELP